VEEATRLAREQLEAERAQYDATIAEMEREHRTRFSTAKEEFREAMERSRRDFSDREQVLSDRCEQLEAQKKADLDSAKASYDRMSEAAKQRDDREQARHKEREAGLLARADGLEKKLQAIVGDARLRTAQAADAAAELKRVRAKSETKEAEQTKEVTRLKDMLRSMAEQVDDLQERASKSVAAAAAQSVAVAEKASLTVAEEKSEKDKLRSITADLQQELVRVKQELRREQLQCTGAESQLEGIQRRNRRLNQDYKKAALELEHNRQIMQEAMRACSGTNPGEAAAMLRGQLGPMEQGMGAAEGIHPMAASAPPLGGQRCGGGARDEPPMPMPAFSMADSLREDEMGSPASGIGAVPSHMGAASEAGSRSPGGGGSVRSIQ